MTATVGAPVATLCAVDTRMITRGRGRATLATAIVAGSLASSLLAGCSSGSGATSRQFYAPADGVYADSGDIRALNVLVVAAEDSSTGVLVMTLANRGERPDRLTAVEADGGSVQLSGPADLPAGGSLRFGHDTDPTALVSGLGADPGEAMELTLRFSRAEPVTLRTVVMPATGDYADITPSATAGS